MSNQNQSARVAPEPSESVRVNFSEADHLFLDELSDVHDVITNDAEVTKLLYVIDKIDEETEKLKQSKQQHVDFFDRKIEAARDQADFLRQRIEQYLDTIGEDKLSTPNGTAFFVNRTKYEYPDDDTLLAFAKEHNLEFSVKEKPLKTPIKEYVEAGGDPPPGFRSHQERSLQIRRG